MPIQEPDETAEAVASLTAEFLLLDPR